MNIKAQQTIDEMIDEASHCNIVRFIVSKATQEKWQLPKEYKGIPIEIDNYAAPNQFYSVKLEPLC